VNPSLLIGFVIGGMLLLSLMVMNNRISQNSAQVTLSEMTRQSMSAVSDIVGHDLRRLGSGAGANPIAVATRNRLVFNGAQEDNAVVQVEWFFDDTLVPAAADNPRERVLLRVADGDTTRMEMGVTSFNFIYFDAAGDTTAVLNDIRRIRVQMMVESKSPIGDEFSQAYWEADHSPRALQ